ncbi:hypothetical protein R3X27_08725 [Tropicimonas sp. TH_r6]|uniref:hypothetical protein n=1 Tax=Tropicimonas sp. TH_r6 TaxID=3082085 RepID=UPI0029530948|nr:hypothetical protein [Tropicimonas sp. TH_r6]MDV7142766.1 hypothetical protein [Tropicimonas sp. TH_r6]
MRSEPPRDMQQEPLPAADCVQALEAWSRDPEEAGFPYAPVLELYLSCGKHFVPPEILVQLDKARSLSRQGQLRVFLDIALDKRDRRYDYSSYCALALLDLPDDGGDLDPGEIDTRRDRMLVDLLGDVIRFEVQALDGAGAPLPQMRPEPVEAEKRVQRALAALRPSVERMDGTAETGLDGARRFLAWRDAALTTQTRLRMALSLQPVHLVHDEYMFLRILQSFEVNFAWIAVLLRRAIRELPEENGAALPSLRQANAILREAARLFPLLGTMQIAAFHDFRRFTEGASAIQSAGYKRVEALCRRPDPERLDSAAYAAVPEVRVRAEDGQETLDDAFAAACRHGRLAAPERDALAQEMRIFSKQLLRWRQAHYQLAKRFLGTRGGTGYTEGVPYLDAVRSVPVFRELPDR